MLDEIDSGTVRILFSLQIAKEENANNIQSNQNNQEMVYQKDEAPAYNEEQSSPSSGAPAVETTETVKREEPKIGRNDFVKITNGEETKEIKFKKAKPLIDSGEWKIV
jgi:preprotein translocase subunit SecA